MPISRCAGCGSAEITFSGGGTQKAEDQLREAFPEARILRIDKAELRKKIEKSPSSPQYIQTHIGVGYRMIRQ